MGQIKFDDIAAALATRFAALTPPTGQTLRGASSRLPNSITELPYFYVFPPLPNEFVYDPYSRTGLVTWPVRLFLNKTDMPQRTDEVYDWMNVLYDVYPVSTSIDLGLGAYVRWARVTNCFPTTFIYGVSLQPGENEYPIVETHVLTHVGEPLS